MVQSGKPVAVFRTHEDAPRVLIANSNMVPAWATQENFDAWEREGLTMYGQMTAGSWIYIGTQGILQGTYETFGALARKHGWGSLSGKLVLTAGLGEMGGAQALAITMNGGVGLLVEVDPWRARRRLELRQVDTVAENLDLALSWVDEALAAGEARSIALIGNAAEVLPELLDRGIVPDVVTDQTAAHDPLYGYIPAGLSPEEARRLRERDPDAYQERSIASMTVHVQAMLDWQKQGSVVFDYGNNLRQRAYDQRTEGGLRLSRFRPGLHSPPVLRRQGSLPLGRPLGRSRGHLPDGPGDPRTFSRGRPPVPLDHDGPAVRGIPGASRPHLLAGIRRKGPGGSEIQRTGRFGRGHRACGHRPRPPRQRFRRQPEPRDRGHEGRIGRHRGLARIERTDQYGEWRNLGELPPWRRRGHRLQPARRSGHRRRRHARGGRAPGARAHQRSGDGRGPARRRRLRRGPGRGEDHAASRSP